MTQVKATKTLITKLRRLARDVVNEPTHSNVLNAFARVAGYGTWQNLEARSAVDDPPKRRAPHPLCLTPDRKLETPKAHLWKILDDCKEKDASVADQLEIYCSFVRVLTPGLGGIHLKNAAAEVYLRLLHADSGIPVRVELAELDFQVSGNTDALDSRANIKKNDCDVPSACMELLQRARLLGNEVKITLGYVSNPKLRRALQALGFQALTTEYGPTWWLA